MRKSLAMILVTAAAGGCVDFGTAQQKAGGGDEECKIEGAAIGRVGAAVQVGGETVVFEEWVRKADSPGEYVGFRISRSASFTVKTGGELHPASGTWWMHPYGDSGPEVPAISNVDFCDEPPPDDGYDCDGGVYDPEDPPEVP